MIRLRRFVVCGLLFGGLVPSAQAFVLLERDDQPVNTVEEAVETAARWSYEPGSVTEGVRGLDEGLEVAIATNFCERLVPQFRDPYPPDCDQVKTALKVALNQWAEEHPVLKFVDVSGTITPALPPPNHPEPWQGFGAELDFFVLNGQEYPAVSEVGGYTSYWSVNKPPRLTNGQKAEGGSTINSADIILNAETCFFFNAQQPIPECNHFQSLVLHEVGHALGLGHPDELPERNLDTDRSPATEIAINCEQPAQGLQASPALEPNAAMNGYAGRPAPLLKLTEDDRGGLRFLYPPCTPARKRIPLWLLAVSLLAGILLIVGSLLFLLLQRPQKVKPR
ncbi:hypothetical protein C1752_03630 [Acaryochloris thomasi RCC1774]|uniref:Peptidase M10 metallopeptidase domain-containing protein n=1 Tax=Acaryochloris thomasi RCC1774 TaxID=1764569 RepID=A0A2W1JNE1_9CYAN|nr:hypothetical protein C1752_03630 [Acaryochloris thomasi RCC1774]